MKYKEAVLDIIEKENKYGELADEENIARYEEAIDYAQGLIENPVIEI